MVIHLKIYNDDITISLDSSGIPLNKRGYRQPEALAPLNESLAAGMIALSGYNGRTDFIDGMCGSGTLCIEAAMIANRIAPGLMRSKFAFMSWNEYDEDLFEIIRTATVNRIKETSVKIVGLDHDYDAICLAKEAAKAAGLEDAIDFKVAGFFETEPPKPPAFLVMNPPYDERLKENDIYALYEDIGNKLKNDYAGYWAWIISGHEEAMYSIGLKSYESHHLLNGRLPCKFSGFRMYSGKKEETKASS